MKPHKHKDLIIAWANGAEIEYFDFVAKEWRVTSSPWWEESSIYRVKPRVNHG
jgi:hypothetical protein